MVDVAKNLAEAAALYGDAPALKSEAAVLSWSQLRKRAGLIGPALSDVAVAAGDRVAIISDDRFRVALACHALWMLGAVVVPISLHFPPPMIAACLRTANCRLALVDEAILGVLQDHCAPCPLTGITDSSQGSAGDRADRNLVALDQPASVIFTSGSGGLPKGVLHTHGNHWHSALGSNANIPLGPGDSWLLSLPLYHVGGLSILYRTMLAGAAAVAPLPHVDLGRQLLRHRATHVSLVTTQLKRLGADQKVREITPLVKAALLGGGPVPASLVQQARDLGLPVLTSYGCTEMASQVTALSPHCSQEQAATSGRLLPYRELRIGRDGEILVRGATLCCGYVDGRNMIDPRDADGWFHTGDIGALDRDGFLTVVGRKDNMFISGGENVYPQQIEVALLSYPTVDQAMVIPTADQEFDQRPVAVVSFGAGRPASSAALVAHLEGALPRFMLPVKFYLWPVEARTGGIKPSRKELGTRLQQGDLIAIE